eukprot:352932-Chlamydomonas_euryale.AAC.2
MLPHSQPRPHPGSIEHDENGFRAGRCISWIKGNPSRRKPRRPLRQVFRRPFDSKEYHARYRSRDGLLPLDPLPRPQPERPWHPAFLERNEAEALLGKPRGMADTPPRLDPSKGIHTVSTPTPLARAQAYAARAQAGASRRGGTRDGRADCTRRDATRTSMGSGAFRRSGVYAGRWHDVRSACPAPPLPPSLLASSPRAGCRASQLHMSPPSPQPLGACLERGSQQASRPTLLGAARPGRQHAADDGRRV